MWNHSFSRLCLAPQKEERCSCTDQGPAILSLHHSAELQFLQKKRWTDGLDGLQKRYMTQIWIYKLTNWSFWTRDSSRQVELCSGPPDCWCYGLRTTIIDHWEKRVRKWLTNICYKEALLVGWMDGYVPSQPVCVTSANGLSHMLHCWPITPGRHWHWPLSGSHDLEKEPTG